MTDAEAKEKAADICAELFMKKSLPSKDVQSLSQLMQTDPKTALFLAEEIRDKGSSLEEAISKFAKNYVKSL